MEIFSAILSAAGKVQQVISDDKKLEIDLKNGLKNISCNMDQMQAYLKDNDKSSSSREQGATHEIWIQQLQDLAYDIEDFVDSLYRKPKEKIALRFGRMVTGTDSRPDYTTEINEFQKRVEELVGIMLSFKSTAAMNGTAAGGPSTSQNRATPSTTRSLVGIDGPKQDLMELLRQVEGERTELRVISILGVRGVGKTALARAVYDARDTFGDSQKFVCHAMVQPDDTVASGSNVAADLLKQILAQVDKGCDASSMQVDRLRQTLRKSLENKRYFIVIDGLQRANDWGSLKEAFPQNGNSSRIIVSTSIRLVARDCSSSASFVYKLNGLDPKDTETLFWNEVGEEKPSDCLKKNAEGILNRCDGLPLAVLCIAKYLRPRWRDLSPDKWEEEARRLSGNVTGDGPEFEDLKRVLLECFDGLTCHLDKTCLMSMTMFPKGHPIKRKSVLRRWLAEGLLRHDGSLNENEVSHKHFDELIERHLLVEPADTSAADQNVVASAQVKRCRVHGVMLEFLVNESVRRKFTELINNNRPVKIDGTISIRRLAVHECSDDGVDVNLNRYSRIRSLTIVKSAFFKDLLGMCPLLRVLDLEGSNGITEDVLCKIFGLLNLKYLSIRGTDACRIPKRIRKLQLLETLDARETKVMELPIEVLLLPQLVHLFGEFELPGELCSKKNVEITSKDTKRVFAQRESKLQTMAEFLVDKAQGFQHILLHMRRLKKVKMRWGNESTTPSQGLTHLLARSLQNRFHGSNYLDSLSINFGGHSLDFMMCLTVPCLLRSIKLRGRFSEGLPSFIQKMEHISELHLFSTGLSSEALSVLQHLQCLEYLKLKEEDAAFGSGAFDVKEGNFEGLKRLTIEATKLPKVTVAQGAMVALTTLELLCDNVTGFAAPGISCLGSLSEVVLLESNSNSSTNNWAAEAKKHKNRPRISFRESSNQQLAAATQQPSGSKQCRLSR